MADATIDAKEARQIRRELERMAEKLRARVAPGHCDYIGKRDAADWADVLAIRLGAAVMEMQLSASVPSVVNSSDGANAGPGTGPTAQAGGGVGSRRPD